MFGKGAQGTGGGPKVILHLDMDAFYASVEQKDTPELAGKAVIVGNSRGGVVTAASYEARKYGVRSAMPVATARKLCPKGVFLPVRIGRYMEVSRQVMHILEQNCPCVEKASVDEAYLDVTGMERVAGPAERFALFLKGSIHETTGLTCSVGIGPNKLIAKIASDWDKPDGLTQVRPEEVRAFMSRVPVGKLPGVGKKTAEVMRELGVVHALDVARFPESFWSAKLGAWGKELYAKAQGIHSGAVTPMHARKSCGSEGTFLDPVRDRETLRAWLTAHCEDVGATVRRRGIKGRTITVKIKDVDFRLHTRSKTVSLATDSTGELIRVSHEIFESMRLEKAVRLIGVSLSLFEGGPVQKSLFSNREREAGSGLDKAVDAIRGRFGRRAIVRGNVLEIDGEQEEEAF